VFTNHSIPTITAEALIDSYEVLLVDAYGVLLDTSGALPGAVDFIRRLNEVRKPYFVVTNDASKLPRTSARRYQELGLAVAADRILTSGSLLTPYFAAHNLAGKRCAVLGPADSVTYVEDAGGKSVSPAEAFDVLVIGDESGFPFLETVDTTLTTLLRLLDEKREVHLLLPNPDRIYPNAEGRYGFAAGSIAVMFEAVLEARYPHRPDLRFVRLGKPDEALFAEALRRSGTRNMVMIGDQLETDIRGARAFGLDAVWVHKGESAAILAGTRADLRPTYRMPSL
jgi:HAD superfamily hydrolase (TIGR01459 family)